MEVDKVSCYIRMVQRTFYGLLLFTYGHIVFIDVASCNTVHNVETNHSLV